jgi:hypothetical protein
MALRCIQSRALLVLYESIGSGFQGRATKDAFGLSTECRLNATNCAIFPSRGVEFGAKGGDQSRTGRKVSLR